MDKNVFYLIAADLIIVTHFLFVAFVVLGLALVLIGKLRSWSWVYNPWFRLAHAAGVGVVALQSWFGAICPLTSWEMALRAKAGEAVYSGSFIAHWLEMILYYQAPAWVFILVYTLFGGLVAASWFWVRPRQFGERGRRDYF